MKQEPMTLAPEAVKAIADAVNATHACRFTDTEAGRIHEFTGLLNDEGMSNFREVIAFGGSLRTIKHVTLKTIVAAAAVAFLSMLGLGLKQKIAP